MMIHTGDKPYACHVSHLFYYFLFNSDVMSLLIIRYFIIIFIKTDEIKRKTFKQKSNKKLFLFANFLSVLKFYFIVRENPVLTVF